MTAVPSPEPAAAGRPSLMPADTPDYMAPAWASCMSWVLGDPDMRVAFEADTGMKFIPPRNGLERMIDDATGHGDAYVAEFIRWANENVWGHIEAHPDDVDPV